MDFETRSYQTVKSFYILTKKIPPANPSMLHIIPKGTLLEFKNLGKHENTSIFNTIDSNPTEIKVNLAYVENISEDEYFLLVAVKSQNRLKTLKQRENLKLANSAKAFTNVLVSTEFGYYPGVLMYKGPIENNTGTYFGVQFEIPYGNCDGSPHFSCEKNHAIYVAVDEIFFCEMNKKPTNKQKSEEKRIQLVSANDYKEKLVIGMRISCNISGYNKIFQGSIRYIGTKESENIVVFGIQLHEKPSKPISNEKIFEDFKLTDCPQDLDYYTTDIKSIIFSNTMADNAIPKDKQISSTFTEPLFLQESEKNKKISDRKHNSEVMAKKIMSYVEPEKVSYSSNHESYSSNHDSGNFYNSIEDSLYEDIPSNTLSLKYQNTHDRSNRLDENIDGNDMYYDENCKPIEELNIPPSSNSSLQVNDLVEFQVSGQTFKGILRWKGRVPEMKFELAGIELDDLPVYPYLVTTNGTFNGKRWFTCPDGKGYFGKLSSCKPDSRFKTSPTTCDKGCEAVYGFHSPPSKVEYKYIGNMKGIQGHVNSCYMDATLFAMFAFNSTFDFMLYKKSLNNVFRDRVQKCLHTSIVNPLRINGFVKQPSIMELRQYLNDIGDIAGFLDKEKDPEEFLTILFEKVLQVEPFMALRSQNQENLGVYLYQIIADINPLNPQPSIQYLMELSFISSKYQLLQVPSVMIIQVPRFGLNKIFNRIQITPTLDLNPFLIDATHLCIICGESSSCYCKNCVCEFGWSNVYTYLCKKCWNTFHNHNKRRNHEMIELSSFSSESFSSNSVDTTMELFAVICIKTSHYVSFVKCGKGDEASWVFFDSMADRHGDYDGYNIPKVIEVPRLKDFLTASPLDISNIKKEDEYEIRLCEDASLCFYRNTQVSMYI